jgi:hypothetical protein
VTGIACPLTSTGSTIRKVANAIASILDDMRRAPFAPVEDWRRIETVLLAPCQLPRSCRIPLSNAHDFCVFIVIAMFPRGFERPRVVRSMDECSFYHSMDIPGHGSVAGLWDLRGDMDAYLGAWDFGGKTVLEIGPASGFVTTWMEQMGASVTALDVDDATAWDFVPNAACDMDAIVEQRRRDMWRLKNGFWFVHAAFGSKARVVYASVYDLPEELGRFDAVVTALVLLHLRDPLLALEHCARHTDTVIVTELLHPQLGEEPVLRLLPTPENAMYDTWWAMTPRLIVDFLRLLGFRRFDVTPHSALHLGEPTSLFTVVARRCA